jgi:hypothetical protein
MRCDVQKRYSKTATCCEECVAPRVPVWFIKCLLTQYILKDCKGNGKAVPLQTRTGL